MLACGQEQRLGFVARLMSRGSPKRQMLEDIHFARGIGNIMSFSERLQESHGFSKLKQHIQRIGSMFRGSPRTTLAGVFFYTGKCIDSVKKQI